MGESSGVLNNKIVAPLPIGCTRTSPEVSVEVITSTARECCQAITASTPARMGEFSHKWMERFVSQKMRILFPAFAKPADVTISFDAAPNGRVGRLELFNRIGVYRSGRIKFSLQTGYHQGL